MTLISIISPIPIWRKLWIKLIILVGIGIISNHTILITRVQCLIRKSSINLKNLKAKNRKEKISKTHAISCKYLCLVHKTIIEVLDFKKMIIETFQDLIKGIRNCSSCLRLQKKIVWISSIKILKERIKLTMMSQINLQIIRNLRTI